MLETNEPFKFISYSSGGFESELSTSKNNEVQPNTSIFIEELQTRRPSKWLAIIRPKVKDVDVKIKVDGKVFCVKRNVLMGNSEMFRKVFEHSEGVAVSLALSGVCKGDFEVVKDWLCGKKNAVNEGNAQLVMDVAKRLEMNDLLKECKKLLRAHGGQDCEGTSDSWDYRSSEFDIKTEIRKKKEESLDKQRARFDEEKKKKEEFKLEQKKRKEFEKKRRADEKKRKVEKIREEKRRKQLEKMNKKMSVESVRSRKFGLHKPTTSFQVCKDDFMASSGISTTTPSSTSNSSTGSKTSTKSMTEVRKTKKKYVHKRIVNR